MVGWWFVESGIGQFSALRVRVFKKDNRAISPRFNPRQMRPPASQRKKRNKPSPPGPRRKAVLAILVTALAVLAVTGVEHYYQPLGEAEGIDPAALAPMDPVPGEGTTAYSYVVARVKRIVDGDTLVVETAGREDRVRLLRVDTPEIHRAESERQESLARKAEEYAQLHLQGRQIRLETPGRGERDRYGRLLAYVLLEGKNFNVELVRQGYSRYETRFGRSQLYGEAFREAQREARLAGRGLWRKEENG
jgi:micrococcal nuclease